MKDIFFLPFTVKYLREVTPYFNRKSVLLTDVGWGGSQDHGRESTSLNNWTESKTIPLRLCYLCKNTTMTDAERIIELHSPDGKSSVMLRFSDINSANEAFRAIHTNINMLLMQAIADANQIFRTAPSQREIKHMGWVSEQVRVLTILSLKPNIHSDLCSQHSN